MPARSRAFLACLALLTTTPILSPHPAAAASFDCSKDGLAADETAVCENRALNDLDVKMATTFDLLIDLVAMGNRDTLKTEQTRWLERRHACTGDVECIKAAYQERLKQLEAAFKTLPRPM